MQKYTYPIYQPYGNKKKQVIKEKLTVAVSRIYARKKAAGILKDCGYTTSSKMVVIILQKLPNKIYS